MPRLRPAVLALLAGVTLLVPLAPVSAGAQLEPSADTLAVNWAKWLPSFVDEFDPASADDCIAGRDKCATKTIKEMQANLDTLAGSCSHDAVFSLAYLRITQGYAWIRNTYDADGSTHYQDTTGMNFVVEVFARAYLSAAELWASGGEPPLAWQIAFDAAKDKRVSGTGDLLLGINAHINRDLAFVMAATGLVKPDGKSRKPDYDKVNELLYLLTQPLSAEESRRFDPSMSSDGGSLADPATFQLIVGWREQAWRNAEALVSAKTDSERSLVAERIEATAATEASLILASNAYLPPVTTTEARDSHCAGHHADAPPKPYPFEVK